MELKKTSRSTYFDYFSRNINRAWLKIIFLCFILILSFFAGGVTRESGDWRKVYNILTNLPNVSYNYIGSFFLVPPKELIIDIKHKNYSSILMDREKALKGKFLIDPSYVPAIIGLDSKSYKVKIRLKGDFLHHIKGKKWSYRVKVKGENTILGMKKFSLHHPNARNFLGEWLFHKTLKDNDVIGLRYDFVKVILNGKNMGLYAIEEHFEKRLIENNNKKEGPIIKFSETGFWNKKKKLKENDIFLTSKIQGFGNSFNNEDDKLNRAISLLENYRKKTIGFNDVFDTETFAKHYAISRILGGEHGERWHNRRFYFNPFLDKLEPIGFDANALSYGSWLDGNLFQNKSLFRWMSSEDNNYFLVKKIVYYLEKFSDKDFLSKYEKELSYFENILRKEFPYYKFDKSFIEKKQTYFKNVLYPGSNNILNCYFVRSTNDSLIFKVGNIQPWPVEVSGLIYKNNKNKISNKKVIIPGRIDGSSVKYFNYSISKKLLITNENFNPSSIKIRCKILGTSKLSFVDITKWKLDKAYQVFESILSKPSKLADLPYFNILDGNKIIFKEGAHNINKNLVIPVGFSVFINENTKINLLNKSSIISYSPLYLLGSQEYPITVASSDSTGQGIFVVNAQDTSVLNFTNFYNLSNPYKSGWGLTGAITFYKSDVEINSCLFSGNLSGDDYLNIVNSNFLINKTKFFNVNADAFDSDFSNGNISSSQFTNCGNDGLDISGSKIKAYNLIMDEIGDKGISAGENSQLKISEFKISNSAIGMCSKDLSSITGDNIFIDNVQIGLTTFQKKPEYGPGRITCNSIVIQDAELPYLIEKESSCIIDLVSINNTYKKVEDILYGVEYGKASN